MIKSAFKGLLERSGFHLFTKGSLPSGADWLLDLKKLGLRASVTFFDVGANVGQTIFEVRASSPQPFDLCLRAVCGHIWNAPGTHGSPEALSVFQSRERPSQTMGLAATRRAFTF